MKLTQSQLEYIAEEFAKWYIEQMEKDMEAFRIEAAKICDLEYDPIKKKIVGQRKRRWFNFFR